MKRNLNLSNLNRFNKSESIINYIDIMQDYIKINVCNLQKNLSFYMNCLFETNLKFNDLLQINKAFQTGNYFLLSSLLEDLKQNVISYRKSFFIKD